MAQIGNYFGIFLYRDWQFWKCAKAAGCSGLGRMSGFEWTADEIAIQGGKTSVAKPASKSLPSEDGRSLMQRAAPIFN
jgi:hypothetical protein